MQRMNSATWADFKATVITKKGLPIQYSESADGYEVFAQDGIFVWGYALLKDGGADVTDFEGTVKAGANQPIDVRGAAGRPVRVAASAQPRGTVERWKGFHVVDPAGSSIFEFDIQFDTDIYLRGGYLIGGMSQNGDKLTARIVMKSNPDIVVDPDLLKDIPVPQGVMVPFLSSESMLLPATLKLRVTYTKTDTGERSVSAIMDYFR